MLLLISNLQPGAEEAHKFTYQLSQVSQTTKTLMEYKYLIYNIILLLSDEHR